MLTIDLPNADNGTRDSYYAELNELQMEKVDIVETGWRGVLNNFDNENEAVKSFIFSLQHISRKLNAPANVLFQVGNKKALCFEIAEDGKLKPSSQLKIQLLDW